MIEPTTNIFQYIQNLNQNFKILLITDTKVNKQYGFYLKNIPKLVLDFNYDFKNLSTVDKILSYISENKFNKNQSILIGFGGGEILNLTGFAASIYLNGIRYVYIPTDLLSMVKDSIDNYCNLDTKDSENSIGFYNRPEKIVHDFRFIQNLNITDLSYGMAYIFKIVLLFSLDVWNYLKINNIEYFQQNFTKLQELIKVTIDTKQAIINMNNRELNNQRLFISFGDLIGSSIDAVFNKQHGHYLGLGMLKELEFGNLTFEQVEEIKQIFKNYKIETEIDNDSNQLILNHIKLNNFNNYLVTLNKICEPKLLNLTFKNLEQVFNLEKEVYYQPNDLSEIEFIAPSSKSETNRLLIIYALSKKVHTLKNILLSDDTKHMINALTQLGVNIKVKNNDAIIDRKSVV